MLCNNVSAGSKLPLQEEEKEEGKRDEGRKREPPQICDCSLLCMYCSQFCNSTIDSFLFNSTLWSFSYSLEQFVYEDIT